MVGVHREQGKPDVTPSLLYTGQFVDYFDNCDVDEMSMFEVMGMVESLGLTYTMKMYWLVSNNPFQVKTLGSDKDILEMLSNIPRDHYVHVYLEEVRPYQFNVVSVEPNDEPSIEESLGEPSVEENFVEPETNDNVDEEHSVEVNIGKPRDDGNVADSNSDSEDIDYEVFKSTSYESGFTDTENDLENESDSEGVGDNVTREESHRHNRKVSDEIMVDNDPESGHYDSFHSLDEADSDGPHKKPRYPEFNTTTDISNPIFKVGLLFATKQVLREAIKIYSINNRYNVKLKRNDNRRIQAVCKAGCPWVLWASPVHFKEPYGTWQIKSLTGEHRCLREYKNSNVTARFMTKQYLDKFFTDPNYSSKSLKQDVFRDYSISVHLSKCTRAKNLALETLHGNIKEQYKKLYDYLGELRSSNPGTTTILKLDEGVFEMLYICMQALKDGFKAGCRPIICLDGCHLKGHYRGHLLAIVGMDADDCLYPIAFAIVEAETESSWCWFMEILKTDLELNNSHHITFMTDKQKGLSSSRHAWLSGKDPTMWTKSHFSFRSKSDILLNNHCEFFNKMIVEARDKGIITLVESIRSKLMQRIAKKMDQAEKLTGPLCPKIQKKLDTALSLSHRSLGRPHKKHRRREAYESPQGTKVSRKSLKMSCTKCGGSGHNTRTCKGLVRANTRPNKRPSTAATSRSKLPVRRGSGTNEHQDTVTTSNQPQPPSQPSPPSQPAPADQTVRWMSTPTTQNNFATQSGREHQGNIPRASQLPPPSQPPPAIHIVRLMPTPNHSGEFCHSIISKAILNTPRINVLIFL
ncbi:hypothetical protein V6N13_114742 [Hibiscus sabdariffa]